MPEFRTLFDSPGCAHSDMHSPYARARASRARRYRAHTAEVCGMTTGGGPVLEPFQLGVIAQVAGQQVRAHALCADVAGRATGARRGGARHTAGAAALGRALLPRREPLRPAHLAARRDGDVGPVGGRPHPAGARARPPAAQRLRRCCRGRALRRCCCRCRCKASHTCTSLRTTQQRRDAAAASTTIRAGSGDAWRSSHRGATPQSSSTAPRRCTARTRSCPRAIPRGSSAATAARWLTRGTTSGTWCVRACARVCVRGCVCVWGGALVSPAAAWVRAVTGADARARRRW